MINFFQDLGLKLMVSSKCLKRNWYLATRIQKKICGGNDFLYTPQNSFPGKRIVFYLAKFWNLALRTLTFKKFSAFYFSCFRIINLFEMIYYLHVLSFKKFLKLCSPHNLKKDCIKVYTCMYMFVYTSNCDVSQDLFFNLYPTC